MGPERSDKETPQRNLDPKANLSENLLNIPASVAPEVELLWRGKTRHKNRKVDALRLVERVHIIPNLCAGTLRRSKSAQDPWNNKLIRGDNRLVMSSLLTDRMRREIDDVGGIKLIYIDPPFLVGSDYKMTLLIGEDNQDRPNIVQEFAYKDSWEAGPSAYLDMMYERLWLIKELLADDGSIWVHCDWKANFMLRSILDEVFGSTAFRNEIIWYYTNKIPDTRKRQYTNATDTIFYYCKSDRSIFNWQFEKREKPIRVSRMQKVEGKKIYPKGPDGKCVYVTREERTADNVWKFPLLHAHPEMWGYPTQKPMRLLERIMLTGTNEGDLVADFFCGSGTSLEVAQRLGRKWIGCDLGKIAVHVCRKRMVKTLNEVMRLSEKVFGFDVLEAEEPEDLKLKKAANAVPVNDYHRGEYNLAKDLAYFKVNISINALTVSVTLVDFCALSGRTINEIFQFKGKTGPSRIILDNGQLVKIVNKKDGSEQRCLLTQKWSDWIDCWAVDFEYGAAQLQPGEQPRVEPDGPIFNSVWHSFRTPKRRSIELSSPTWEYECPGNYNIAVKVIDIFGNETFQVLGIEVL